MSKKIIIGTGTVLNEAARIEQILMERFPIPYNEGTFLISDHMQEIIDAAIHHPHSMILLEGTWINNGHTVSSVVLVNEIRARTMTGQFYQYTLHPRKDEGGVFHGILKKNPRNEEEDELISHIQTTLRPVKNFVFY